MARARGRGSHARTAPARARERRPLGWLSSGHNNCNLNPAYSPYAVDNYYNGVSSYEADMHLNSSGDHVCGDGSTDGRDHQSVVDFGNLDTGYSSTYAMTCKWTLPQPFNKNNILEADIRFNITDHDFYYAKPSNCAGDVDLRGVAIHEFGHAYGMGHVSESAHGNLTMSQYLDYCDNSQRTLGKGDLLSLKEIYG